MKSFSKVRILNFSEPLGSNLTSVVLFLGISPADASNIVANAPAWQFSVRCQKLIKADGGPLGSSDPFFTIAPSSQPNKLVRFSSTLYLENFSSLMILQLYRSEVYEKNLNPTFKPFNLNTHDFGGLFGSITITVWDSDKDGANDCLGQYQTSLYELLAFGPFQYPLYKDGAKGGFGLGKSAGAFCVDRMDPVDASHLPPPPLGFFVTCEIRNMKRQDGLLGKADPWFAVLAKPEFKPAERVDRLAQAVDPSFVTVYKSEVHRKTLTPVFKKFPIMLSDVANNLDAPICTDTSFLRIDLSLCLIFSDFSLQIWWFTIMSLMETIRPLVLSLYHYEHLGLVRSIILSQSKATRARALVPFM